MTTSTPTPRFRPPIPLVLASSSPYRRSQLSQLGLTYTWQSPAIDETPQGEEAPHTLALRLAESKARAVAQQLSTPARVIGCDQTASCGSILLGKPGNEARAVEQLSLCSGQTVVFHSALCVLDTQAARVKAGTSRTTVRFRSLNESEIRTYIKKEQPLDCAGSFKCEGLGIALFECIESSDPSALIGLPLILLTQFLRELDFNVIEHATHT